MDTIRFRRLDPFGIIKCVTCNSPLDFKQLDDIADCCRDFLKKRQEILAKSTFFINEKTQ